MSEQADIFDLIERLADADARDGALIDIINRTAEAVPALLGIVQNPDSKLRPEAVWALGEIGPDAEPAIEPLIHVLRGTEEDIEIRSRAARALKDIDLMRPRVLGHLILAAGSEKSELSAEICGLLGPLARLNPHILDTHVGALKHKNVEVRRGAAAVLKRVSEADADEIYIRQAARRMADMEPDEDEAVRENVAAAVERINGKSAN